MMEHMSNSCEARATVISCAAAYSASLSVSYTHLTSEGRIDLVLQTDKFIYIMEFKLNGTAEDALQQINDKNYALPFEMDGRKLFKIGVNFSAETRNIEKWIVETKN